MIHNLPIDKELDSVLETIDLIADRWSLIVIYFLRDGSVLRYGELSKQIGKISSKVLTQTLRRLERNGLVQRKVYPVIPPRVEYSLTPLGMSFVEPITAFCGWSDVYLEDVKSARKQFDSEQSTG